VPPTFCTQRCTNAATKAESCLLSTRLDGGVLHHIQNTASYRVDDGVGLSMSTAVFWKADRFQLIADHTNDLNVPNCVAVVLRERDAASVRRDLCPGCGLATPAAAGGHVCGVHLKSGEEEQNETQRLEQITRILGFLSVQRAILMGDFNADPVVLNARVKGQNITTRTPQRARAVPAVLQSGRFISAYPLPRSAIEQENLAHPTTMKERDSEWKTQATRRSAIPHGRPRATAVAGRARAGRGPSLQGGQPRDAD
jgi:hypothetical protein